MSTSCQDRGPEAQRVILVSYLEDSFQKWLDQTDFPTVHEVKREFEFAPPRKWRFDFAFTCCHVAVEIEGGLYKGGRHQTLEGFLADSEKYEAALVHGWTVYRVPGPWGCRGRTHHLAASSYGDSNNTFRRNVNHVANRTTISMAGSSNTGTGGKYRSHRLPHQKKRMIQRRKVNHDGGSEIHDSHSENT